MMSKMSLFCCRVGDHFCIFFVHLLFCSFCNTEAEYKNLMRLEKFRYDGFNLRDGQEIAVDLASKRHRDYFMNIPAGRSHLWLVVTPCGGMVKWKLAQQQPMIGENEFSDDIGQWYRANDSYSIGQASYFATLKDRQKHLLWHKDIDRVSNDYMRIKLPVMETMLFKEVGNRAMEYSRENMPAGNLHLYLLATENETLSARIYATTSSDDQVTDLSQHFPTLPRKKRVNLLNITKTSVAVSWEHSPSLNIHKYFGIEYCLILSSTKHYSTLCHYEEIIKSTTQYSKIFGKYPSNAINEGQKLKIIQKRNNVVSGKYSQDPYCTCTRYKTNYYFDRLKPNTKYHLSLFAINRATGGSVAYDGASFVTRSEGLFSSTVVKMIDSQMYASYLNPTRSSFRLYEIIVDKFRPQLLITVQACTGYLRLNLYKDGQLLRKSVFEDLKSFLISNVQPGVVRVKVINDDNESKLFKIWASKRSSKNPYPRLPVDPSLKASENGRTCRSIEIMWLKVARSDIHVYRLYVRAEEEAYFKRLILEQANQCQGPSPQSKLIFERKVGRNLFRNSTSSDSQEDDEYFDHNSDDNDLDKTPDIMTAVVNNLKPDTTYRFDLFVAKPNRQQLPYRTVWVKTKLSCEDAVQSIVNLNEQRT